MTILRPKRQLSRQEIRRYVVNRLTLNPRVVKLSRKRRRELARASLKEVRKNQHGKVYVVAKPCSWFQFLKETFLPQWALSYCPVRYTDYAS